MQPFSAERGNSRPVEEMTSHSGALDERRVLTDGKHMLTLVGEKYLAVLIPMWANTEAPAPCPRRRSPPPGLAENPDWASVVSGKFRPRRCLGAQTYGS